MCERKWFQPTWLNCLGISPTHLELTILRLAMFNPCKSLDFVRDGLTVQWYINVIGNIAVEIIERFINFMLHFMVTMFPIYFLSSLIISNRIICELYLFKLCIYMILKRYMLSTCRDKFDHVSWNYLWSNCTCLYTFLLTYVPLNLCKISFACM